MREALARFLIEAQNDPLLSAWAADVRRRTPAEPTPGAPRQGDGADARRTDTGRAQPR